MPVVKEEPPVKAAEVVGLGGRAHLLDELFHNRASLDSRLGDHMSPRLPMIGAGEAVGAAMAALELADAVVVLDDGLPVGVITRQDLLGFLAARATP